MSCGSGKSCCKGGCAGNCNNSDVSVSEIGLNSIVELEIHYRVSEEAKTEAYIFESVCCLTNIQVNESRLTGLEGNSYDSLDLMKSQVIDRLVDLDNATSESYKDVDVIYISDDV
ncbi:MAG TPA: hypothetical protein VEF53_02295 [Patescibacteria group bacterium]|nr:hypothetical protein [Patescibacteria group bacterium]